MPTLAPNQRNSLRRLSSLLAAAALALGALLLLRALAEAAASPAAPSAAANAAASAAATTFNVNTTADLPDDNAGDGNCRDTGADHKCSLRAALQELNALNHSSNVINLPGQTYTLTDDAHGDLQIAVNVTLNGSLFLDAFSVFPTFIVGSPLTWTHRILRVQDGAHVVLHQLGISGGNVPTGNGGGIDVVAGSLGLENVVVAGNKASYGGGIYNAGVVTSTRSSIDNNQALNDGGGLYNSALAGANGQVTSSIDTLYGNVAIDGGGAFFNYGSLTLQSDTLQANHAAYGGGADNMFTATLRIENSTLYSNSASVAFGGLASRAQFGSMVIVNSTIAANATTGYGGGMGGTGPADLDNVTLTGNIADSGHTGGGDGGGLYGDSDATFNLENTLVAGNIDPGGEAPDCSAVLHSVRYSLIGNTHNCTLSNAVGNRTNLDPQLLPYGYFGGLTDMFGLKLTSPAVDHGDPTGCRAGLNTLLVDQRGQPRATDGDGNGVARCDIGAYELQLSRLYLTVAAR